MILTSKSKFEAMTTERKSFSLFIDGQMSDDYKRDKKIFMKLTNADKQIILKAHDSELEKLVYDYFALRYGATFRERFRGFSVLLFEELDKWIMESNDDEL